jgi:hypothetical protein
MMRCATVGILACVFTTGLAQRHVPTEDLVTLLREVPAHPNLSDDELSTAIIDRLQTAPLAEVKANIPTLMALTESGDGEVRSLALLSLVNLGFTNRGSQSIQAMGLNPVPDLAPDLTSVALLVPYLPTLLDLMATGSPADRGLSFSIVQEISRLRPVPAGLVPGLIRLLSGQQSTMPLSTMEDELRPGTPPSGPSLGPELLWILLPAAATYYRDPVTNLMEGWDTPEVQDAVLEFLNRGDQTAESMAESIRALALAQAQNPRVNATLVKMLDSPSPEIQLALVQQLPKIALTSDAYLVGKERVMLLKDDPSTTPEVRAAAAKMLLCWTNDQHHGGMCPVAGTGE